MLLRDVQQMFHQYPSILHELRLVYQSTVRQFLRAGDQMINTVDHISVALMMGDEGLDGYTTPMVELYDDLKYYAGVLNDTFRIVQYLLDNPKQAIRSQSHVKQYITALAPDNCADNIRNNMSRVLVEVDQIDYHNGSGIVTLMNMLLHHQDGAKMCLEQYMRSLEAGTTFHVRLKNSLSLILDKMNVLVKSDITTQDSFQDINASDNAMKEFLGKYANHTYVLRIDLHLASIKTKADLFQDDVTTFFSQRFEDLITSYRESVKKEYKEAFDISKELSTALDKAFFWLIVERMGILKSPTPNLENPPRFYNQGTEIWKTWKSDNSFEQYLNDSGQRNVTHGIDGYFKPLIAHVQRFGKHMRTLTIQVKNKVAANEDNILYFQRLEDINAEFVQ